MADHFRMVSASCKSTAVAVSKMRRLLEATGRAEDAENFGTYCNTLITTMRESLRRARRAGEDTDVGMDLIVKAEDVLVRMPIVTRIVRVLTAYNVRARVRGRPGGRILLDMLDKDVLEERVARVMERVTGYPAIRVDLGQETGTTILFSLRAVLDNSGDIFGDEYFVLDN